MLTLISCSKTTPAGFWEGYNSSMGVICFFNSEADRSKFFNNDGTMTALGKAASTKLSNLNKEMDKFGTPSDAADKYNDWLVQ